MNAYDVQTVQMDVPFDRAFDYIADARNLPEWTSAFKEISGGRALLQTPQGSVDIELQVKASRETGTIDWIMTFPDQIVSVAYSRLVEAQKGGCLFSFILLPPPLPLAQIEGALEAQSEILKEELSRLKTLLTRNRGA